MDYYPPQPYQGNGGNPMMLDAYGDNSTFLENIYYSNNYMFSNLTPAPRINAYNFAINNRCYNPLNNNWLYDGKMADDADYNWNFGSVNADCAMGMSFIH